MATVYHLDSPFCDNIQTRAFNSVKRRRYEHIHFVSAFSIIHLYFFFWLFLTLSLSLPHIFFPLVSTFIVIVTLPFFPFGFVETSSHFPSASFVGWERHLFLIDYEKVFQLLNWKTNVPQMSFPLFHYVFMELFYVPFIYCIMVVVVAKKEENACQRLYSYPRLLTWVIPSRYKKRQVNK